ncbi:glycosyltransferase family 4 protein [Meridianimaribacter flavus]
MTSEFPPQPGGIGNHAYQLAHHLQEASHTVTVIADERSDSGVEEAVFDNTLSFKIHRIVKRRLRVLMYFKRICLLFKYLPSNEIVIASGKFPLWVVAFASLFYKRQYMAVLHGSEVNFTQSLLNRSIRVSLQRFTTLVAVSHFTKSLVQGHHDAVVVIPNGIPVRQFDAQAILPKDLKGYPKLITVGNVTERKGQLNVIRQLPELIKAYPELHYHCVGLPTQRDAFEAEASLLGVLEHVSFHGRVSDMELRSFLNESDIFVMLSSPTSTGDVEGFGIAILEANAMGLPAIGALGCGIEDAIEDFKSGRLIAYDDLVAFKTSIEELMTQNARYKENARSWALNHDWAVIVNRYIALFEK